MNKLWQFGLLLWLGAVSISAFLWAPLAQGLGEYTRVLYFHVPVAWVTVLAFLIGAVFSVLFLMKRKFLYDQIAEAASQLGLIYCILATVTGSIWAKVSWGSFWNWDPRETSIFILLLIYAAYFALRSAIEHEERRAVLGAVYSIFAFVTVPFFVLIVPRVYSSLHPDPLINTQAKINMDGKMLTTFLSSLFGFTVLFLWMLKSKIALVKIKLRLREMEN
ncbi:MAG: cytochrome C biogenesis protein [Calditrichales bacterium]|nr:MAG: cytochrome C biogenesis protein [Calditrichales bacterium]